jgi:hypothetical protein
MKQKFGNLWQIVDKLAGSEPTVENSSKLSFQAKGLCRFLLVDIEKDFTIVETSALQVIKAKSKEKTKEKWIQHSLNQTADMQNPQIDWNKSIWPLLQPFDQGSKAIGNFQYKLCQKVLSTKKLMFALVQQYEKFGWPKSILQQTKARMKLKYSEDLCFFCNFIANTD